MNRNVAARSDQTAISRHTSAQEKRNFERFFFTRFRYTQQWFFSLLSQRFRIEIPPSIRFETHFCSFRFLSSKLFPLIRLAVSCSDRDSFAVLCFVYTFFCMITKSVTRFSSTYYPSGETNRLINKVFDLLPLD